MLTGRCLPYGESITYWPLAEMVKTSAGISDDDPLDEAIEKLRVCCEDEAIADLLGLASGVLHAVRAERRQEEIAWAVREWAEKLAEAQPLVLVFEDIHWAEEPLFELIEHLSEWVRQAPLLIVCLARPELLDVRPGWGGGRVRSVAIELEPLPPEESEQLVDALLPQDGLSPAERTALLDKTEGNPLFVEETIRMLTDGRRHGRRAHPRHRAGPDRRAHRPAAAAREVGPAAGGRGRADLLARRARAPDARRRRPRDRSSTTSSCATSSPRRSARASPARPPTASSTC